MKVTIMPLGPLGTNCYILSSQENSCIVFDPAAQAEKLIDFLREKELTPKYILLTHGHFDHIGATNKLREAYSGLPVYIGAGDLEVVTDPAKSNAVVLRGLPQEDYIINGALEVKEGDEFALDELTVTTLETPGHTKGGLTFLCENLMFSGDTLFQENVGRTDLYGGDFNVLLQSLKKLAALDGDYEVYPGHGPSTTLEHERQRNPYIKL